MGAPEITGLDGDNFTYLPGNAALTLDQGVSASANDADFMAFNGGSLTVSFVSGEVPGEDRIGIRNTGSGPGEIAAVNGVIAFEGIMLGTWSGGASGDPLIVRLSGNANETAVAALVRALTYENTSGGSATGGVRQLSVVAVDAGGEQSNTALVTATVEGGARIGALDGDVAILSATGAPTSIDAGARLTVSGGQVDFGGAVLTISHGAAGSFTLSLGPGVTSGGNAQFSNGEMVAIGGTNVATVTNDGSAGDLVLQFLSGATVGDVETVLRAVQASATDLQGTPYLDISLQLPGHATAASARVSLASVPDGALPVVIVSGVGADTQAQSLQDAASLAGTNAVIVVDGNSYALSGETVVLRGESITLSIPDPHAVLAIMGHDADQPRALTLLGDGAADVIGNALANDIFGNAGDNTISGLGGADTILGGAGNDHLYGQDGNDLIDGGAGDDTIIGDGDDDTLLGGDGDDLIVGGQGNDTLYGGRGNDVLQGLDDDDTLIGEAGDDVLWGDGGRDLLIGNVGNDTLIGGDDNDTLIGDEGDDILEGGNGADLLTGGSGNDRLDGGADSDILQGFEGDDTLTGGAGDDSLAGGFGADIFVFADGSGTDRILDFEAGSGIGDRIDLSAFGFADLDAVLAASTDGGGGQSVTLQLDADDAVTLLGVVKADFAANDFIFA